MTGGSAHSPQATLLGLDLRGRVLFVGVGREGAGDDALGCEFARRLAIRALSRESDAVTSADGKASRPLSPCSTEVWMGALDCGERPEDFTADMAALEPDSIVFVDAVEMCARPGSAALVRAGDTTTAFPETHRTSLSVVMDYVALRTGAQVWLLGVQPRSLRGPRLTAEISHTLDLLAAQLNDARAGTGSGS